MGKYTAFWAASASTAAGSRFLRFLSGYPRVKGMEQRSQLRLGLWCVDRALSDTSPRQTDLETKPREEARLGAGGRQR